jgi:4-hydroxy-tetrahydrodipicolinate synthase
VTETFQERPPLGGVLAAMITPLDERGRLDHGALTRIVDHLFRSGVHGTCPAGTTGEGALLSREVRAQLTAEVVAAAPASAWVIPGVMGTTLANAREDLHAYADAGASAALVGVPYYYRLSDEEIYRWYAELAESSTLPLVLYNIPVMTKLTIAPAVVERLAIHERIAGMKDSSRDLVYFQQVREATREESFALLTGSDALVMASTLLGGDGVIGAGVNVIPDLITQLWNATRSGNLASATALQQRVARVVASCVAAGIPMGFKAALSILGVCQPYPAFPLQPPNPEVTGRLATELGELGVPTAAPAI